MARDMPVQDLRQTPLDHRSDEQSPIVNPLGDHHQVALPKDLLGLLRQFIGKYLSSLRKLDHVIAPKEGFEAQL